MKACKLKSFGVRLKVGEDGCHPYFEKCGDSIGIFVAERVDVLIHDGFFDMA